MQIHFTDFVTAANLLVLLGIYRKLSIIVYQHKLMWTDFADRKGISANGKHAASVQEWPRMKTKHANANHFQAFMQWHNRGTL